MHCDQRQRTTDATQRKALRRIVNPPLDLEVILSSYLTLHRQNKTGRNTAIAMVMGINQLSSDAYGSWSFGPDVFLNFLSFGFSSSQSETYIVISLFFRDPEEGERDEGERRRDI